jgi:hypothetical protein
MVTARFRAEVPASGFSPVDGCNCKLMKLKQCSTPAGAFMFASNSVLDSQARPANRTNSSHQLPEALEAVS